MNDIYLLFAYPSWILCPKLPFWSSFPPEVSSSNYLLDPIVCPQNWTEKVEIKYDIFWLLFFQKKKNKILKFLLHTYMCSTLYKVTICIYSLTNMHRGGMEMRERGWNVKEDYWKNLAFYTQKLCLKKAERKKEKSLKTTKVFLTEKKHGSKISKRNETKIARSIWNNNKFG